MRCTHVALLLVLAILAAGARPAHADAMPLEMRGATIGPRTNTEVRLVSERVDVDVGRDAVLVAADFHLRNEGGPADLDVGFPMGEGQTPWSFRAFLVSDEPPGERELAVAARPDWFAWPMHFGAGEAVHLRVTYYQMTAWVPHIPFRYILRTGAAWKGSIGEAAIRVRFPGRERCSVTWAVPDGYRFDGSTLAWDLRDFEPDFDVAVCWKQGLSVTYTDRCIPDALGSALPQDLQAWPTYLPLKVARYGGQAAPPLTSRREGNTLVLQAGSTVVKVRDGERRAVVDGVPRELPAPVRVEDWRVHLPLGLLCELGWRQARYYPEREMLVISTRGLNTDEGEEPLLQRAHRTPRPASHQEYEKRVAALEAAGLRTPEALFEHAELFYYAGGIDRSREGFAACAAKAPEGEWGGPARFWQAQCLAHREDFRAAVAALKQVPTGSPLAPAARLQAAEWLSTHDDLYSLPAGRDRLTHALALAEEVRQGAPEPDLARRAAVLTAGIEEKLGRHDEAEQVVRDCLRRFPGDDAVLPLLLTWAQTHGQTRARVAAMELVAEHFPAHPRTRAALAAHLANSRAPKPTDRGWDAPTAERLRTAVERILAAAPPKEDAAARLRLAARRWLGQRVLDADALTARLRAAKAEPDSSTSSTSLDGLFDECLKRGDTAGARRVLSAAAELGKSWERTTHYWEEQLAVAEGDHAEALRLVERGLLEGGAFQLPDNAYLDLRHARVATALLKLGRVKEAADRFEEAYARARAMERRHYDGGCLIQPEFYRAGAAVLRAQDPASSRAAALASIADLPLYPSYGKPPVTGEGLARLEALVRRYPREPLAWFALGQAHRLLMEAGAFRYRQAMEEQAKSRVKGKPASRAWQTPVDAWNRSCRRLLQAWGRALDLDPQCDQVLARLPEGVPWNSPDAPAQKVLAGWMEAALRRRPDDARLRLPLVRWYRERGGEAERLRAHREALLRTLESGWSRGLAVLSPMADDVAQMAEQYRALGREPVLAAVKAQMQAPVPGREPRTSEDVAAAIARLELALLTDTGTYSCRELGRLYERAGRPRDAARAYRIGLVRVGEDPYGGERAGFRKLLDALPPAALAEEDGRP